MFKLLKEKMDNFAANCEYVKELEECFPDTYNKDEEMYSTCLSELFLKSGELTIVGAFIYFILKNLKWI